MAKGYWIAHVTVTDPDQYARYAAAAAEPLRQYGAVFLARGGRHEICEGTDKSRHVVIEFPSFEAAVSCFHSPLYQEARSFRMDVAEADVIIVEGVNPPS